MNCPVNPVMTINACRERYNQALEYGAIGMTRFRECLGCGQGQEKINEKGDLEMGIRGRCSWCERENQSLVQRYEGEYACGFCLVNLPKAKKQGLSHAESILIIRAAVNGEKDAGGRVYPIDWAKEKCRIDGIIGQERDVSRQSQISTTRIEHVAPPEDLKLSEPQQIESVGSQSESEVQRNLECARIDCGRYDPVFICSCEQFGSSSVTLCKEFLSSDQEHLAKEIPETRPSGDPCQNGTEGNSTKHGPYELIGRELGALCDAKHAAYGMSVGKKSAAFLSLLYPDGIKPENYADVGVLVRMFDKMMRIATSKNAFGENPYKDLAGYAILMSGGKP